MIEHGEHRRLTNSLAEAMIRPGAGAGRWNVSELRTRKSYVLCHLFVVYVYIEIIEAHIRGGFLNWRHTYRFFVCGQKLKIAEWEELHH